MEHLQLFAALKGVAAASIDELCYEVCSSAQPASSITLFWQAIAAVGLTEKLEQFSCTLSGGMKRKLSLAIAIIGDSKALHALLW